MATHDRGASPAADEDYTIARATTRLRVDFDRLSEAGARALRAELYEARKLVVTVANYLARSWWRLDADGLDAFLAREGRLPQTLKEWPKPKRRSDGYAEARPVTPTLSPGITAAVTRMVAKKWRKERWAALVLQQRSPPHFKDTLPVPVREQEHRIFHREDGFWVSFPLKAGTGQRVVVPLEVRDEFQKRQLSLIVSGVWKAGELKVEQDRKRPSRWYVRVAFKRRVARSAGVISMAVNRGIRCHLVAVTSAGDVWRYDGNDIVAYLKQIQARRRQYQRDAKACMRGGRGRTRILRPIEPLIQKGERWRKTKCQTIARRLAEWAQERGVTQVYREDFSGIRRGEPERLEGGERAWRMIQEWPYHEQGTRLDSCLEEHGIGVAVENAPHYISQRCPACGLVCRDNRDLSRWRLRCVNPDCGFSRDLDEAACLNELARASVPPSGAPWKNEDMYERSTTEKRGSRKHDRRTVKGIGSGEVSGDGDGEG